MDLKDHLAEIADRSHTVLTDVIDPDVITALNDDLLRLETELGTTPSRNDFEGAATIRIYNLLTHGPLYEAIPVHDEVLPLVEGVLDPGCLASSLSSISIGPGGGARPRHPRQDQSDDVSPGDAVPQAWLARWEDVQAGSCERQRAVTRPPGPRNGRLRQLVGYSVYHGLIGHIDKTDPVHLLGDSPDHTMVWDAAGATGATAPPEG